MRMLLFSTYDVFDREIDFFSRKNLILVEKFNQKISIWNIFSIYTKKWRNIKNIRKNVKNFEM